jgi:hypothetical protein
MREIIGFLLTDGLGVAGRAQVSREREDFVDCLTLRRHYLLVKESSTASEV